MLEQWQTEPARTRLRPVVKPTTVQIAREYADQVFQRGPERSAQVNFGVKQASGKYAYKVDSDFVLDPRVIESCVSEIHRGFDAIVVHNSPDPSVGWIARLRKFEVDMYKYDIGNSSARFVRTTVFESLAGFDETITAGEDYDFQSRLNAAGYKTGFVEPEAQHLGEPTSFWEHMRKYYDYGRDFVIYANKNPSDARIQLRFVRQTYLKHWREFARHPIIGCEFFAYNVCKFAFGGVGFLAGRWKSRHRLASEV